VFENSQIVKDRYQIKNILGQGGTAITYAAIDLETQETVVLKVMSLRRAQDWKAIELFEREAQILAQLEHPAIPKYLGYFQLDTDRDREFYIVQTLAPGTPLATLIDRGWEPTVTEVEDIANQILGILDYLHRLSPPIIHRDIKPQNLIKNSEGQIFIVDFGAVQATYHQTITGGSTVVGTYGYMAPEQFRGQAFLSTDLYGLAATLLFLLTRTDPGKLPQKQLKINFRSAIKLPSKFADWLERMLEPIVEQRFTTAAEALAVLNGVRSLPPRLANNRPRKPNDSPIRAIFDESEMTISIPPVRLRTPNSQQLCLVAAIANFILLVSVFFIVTSAPLFDPIKLLFFGSSYIIFSLSLAGYTIYGNLSEIKFKIHHNRYQLQHWLGGYLCYKSVGNIEALQIAINKSWMPILPFDRSRVTIALQNKPHLLFCILDRLMRDKPKTWKFILDPIERLRHKYTLALLLTPAENYWLASELNIFLDRALRRQKLYDLAIDKLSQPSQTVESVVPLHQ
jgi:eukaryotic-like serine/threonine-protein kinase